MSNNDMSEIQITLAYDDVEKVIRTELRDAIKVQKKEIIILELNKVHPEHEDLVFGKAFVRAAAVVLKYYTVPSEWKKLDEISD